MSARGKRTLILSAMALFLAVSLGVCGWLGISRRSSKVMENFHYENGYWRMEDMRWMSSPSSVTSRLILQAPFICDNRSGCLVWPPSIDVANVVFEDVPYPAQVKYKFTLERLDSVCYRFTVASEEERVALGNLLIGLAQEQFAVEPVAAYGSAISDAVSAVDPLTWYLPNGGIVSMKYDTGAEFVITLTFYVDATKQADLTGMPHDGEVTWEEYTYWLIYGEPKPETDLSSSPAMSSAPSSK